MKVFRRLGSSTRRLKKAGAAKRTSKKRPSAAQLRARKAFAAKYGGKKRKRRKIAAKHRAKVGVLRNPIHLPRTARGRPAHSSYWLLDVYSGNAITTYIGHANRTDAERDAQRVLVQKKAEKVALSGPYARQPSLAAKRR